MRLLDNIRFGVNRSISRARRKIRKMRATSRLTKAREFLSVDFDGEGIGFFAHMNVLLRTGRYAASQNLIPDIRFIGSTYLDNDRGPDWLSYYFDRTISAPTTRSRSPIYIRDLSEFPISYEHDISLNEAHELLFRFYRLRPEIEDAVTGFCGANNVGVQTLGIHYRGTDKAAEAPRVSVERVIESALSYIAKHKSISSVFLASDEGSFVTQARSALKDYEVSCLLDSVRSLDGRPIHLGRSGAGYLIGRDALLNALVLSRCRALIRTSSFLSAWSSIFQPATEVLLLNRPFSSYLWYPEREILKTATMLD